MIPTRRSEPSGSSTRLIGILLVLAGFGYLIDEIGPVLGAGYSLEISRFAFVGEAVLVFWLLINGIRGTCPKRTTLSERNRPLCVHGLRVFGSTALLGTLS